jgi:hypothetical protein
MKKGLFHIVITCLLSLPTFAQRPHLELGATVGFKDEFFLRPEFAPGAAFAEFHIYDLTLFTRISKARWGAEIDLGFEKAANYFIRFDGASTSNDYFNLNRLKNGVYAHYYLLKNARNKWDIQLGCTQSFNFSPLFLGTAHPLKTWKLSARGGLNYTFKSFISGLFYEYTLRNDYTFSPPNALFGLRLGLIY